jgi:prepilin-type N-terminal cleavage/methylation domain-containing protein
LLKRNHKNKEKGFSLLETLVAIFLLAIALLAMAQLFILGVINNAQSDVVTSANFLAQQQIDILRNLSLDELNTWVSNSPVTENLNINGDVDENEEEIIDFRRVTEVSLFQGMAGQFLVRVRVYSELNAVGNPDLPKADIRTVISR